MSRNPDIDGALFTATVAINYIAELVTTEEQKRAIEHIRIELAKIDKGLQSE